MRLQNRRLLQLLIEDQHQRPPGYPRFEDKSYQCGATVPILRPLVAQQGHLAAYAATNVLIVSDRASNIRRIERIISEMDKESDSDIEIIKLKHAFAAEVVRLLSSLNVTTPDQKTAAGAVKLVLTSVLIVFYLVVKNRIG